ncbi:MAG: ABC transporter permease subunit [Armatimonadota bacterium]
MSQDAAPPPIADLTYRNYDGPKELRRLRWWTISRSFIRAALRKKPFWVLFGLLCMQWMLFVLFVFINSQADQITGGAQRGLRAFNLANTFADVTDIWIWVFAIALFIGAGSIAADNRANAVQVYLSKPLTRADYILGKWAGMVILLYFAQFVPMLVAVLYAALDQGFGEFFRSYSRLALVFPLVPLIPAVIHASMLIGISALNRTPAIAGIAYTGIFIVWNVLAATIAWAPIVAEESRATVMFLNPRGVIYGLIFNLLGTRGTPPGFRSELPLPEWAPLLGLAVVLCAGSLALAVLRVRAVEVVKG